MSTQQKHNFGAGPCILPASVIHQAANAVQNWNGMGLSILEVSHRSKEFEEVIQQTEQLVRELLLVPDEYEVLFLQGGASTQFSMVPLSLLTASGHQKAAYLDTGYFACKAIDQARLCGEVQIVASSRDKDYNYIPSSYQVHHDVAYLHLTTNNTIEGTEIFDFPAFGVPLVADMSSDIFSKRFEIRNFDLIYAGAQKNMGPAGMTLVIVKKDLLKRVKYPVAAMSDYRVYAANNSMYNTPPVFSIYVAMLNLQWLKEQGGVAAIEVENIKKAQLLYEAIDNSKLFYGTAEPAHRSRMNVTFRCHEPKHEEGFLKYAQDRGIVGIKGYRTVGGFRASLYNALPVASVQFLVKTMAYYEKMQELKTLNKMQAAKV